MIKWIKQILHGLLKLKQYRFVHGDIHPKNILLFESHLSDSNIKDVMHTQSCNVKLCDFNLSHFVPQDPTEDQLEDMQAVNTCTFPFISPFGLIYNDYVPKRSKLHHTIEKVSKEMYSNRDLFACDVFAFGLLITHILFNEHMLFNPDNHYYKTIEHVTSGCLKEMKHYFKDPSGINLFFYINTQYHRHNMKPEVEAYQQYLETHNHAQTTFDLGTISYVLEKCLQVQQRKRATLEQLQSVIDSW